MKKLILISSFLLVFNWVNAQNQHDTLLSTATRFKSFPPVKLLMPDSTTYFTKANLEKNKPVLLMVFHPSCEHCQHETEDITKNIEKFRGTQIVMSTMVPLFEMKAFMDKYQLAAFKNIIVAQDYSFFLPPYFQFNNLPFLAFYNKKKKLVSTFGGTLSTDKILTELRK
ncbi:MAG TPA: redoxin domain-containing protein [Chitinophagaceae bacterium]|nr:redoxin domain-containing protein [Chitinophagaceae bacterium]